MIPLWLVRDEITKLAGRWGATADDLDAFKVPHYSGVIRRLVVDLWGLFDEIERRATFLTPEQYAQAHNVTPGTVRRWIRTGQIAAKRDAADDWKIKHDAVRQKRPRLRRAA